MNTRLREHRRVSKIKHDGALRSIINQDELAEGVGFEPTARSPIFRVL